MPDAPAEPRRRSASGEQFVHSVLSFTRLDIPEAEVFESVVTFDADTDPLTAHDRLAAVFGNKAGSGYFLFRADSSLPGRYWVRSVEPWAAWPDGAVSVLEPTRKVIQLAGGLMYHFTLQVCAGRERIIDGQKHIDPFTTAAELEAWFESCAVSCGFKLLMHSAAPSVLRFRHGTQGYKVMLGTIEGALEIVEPAPMRKALLRGFGSHRRLGLGMLTLST
jgi:hypothetical protein